MRVFFSVEKKFLKEGFETYLSCWTTMITEKRHKKIKVKNITNNIWYYYTAGKGNLFRQGTVSSVVCKCKSDYRSVQLSKKPKQRHFSKVEAQKCGKA